MSQNAATGGGKKGNDIMRALLDLVILSLLLGAAGFGGYFYGVHQQVAPILKVAAGTPGAVAAAPAAMAPPTVSQAAATAATSAKSPPSAPASKAQVAEIGTASSSSSSSREKSVKKFWLTSSGQDYIGYSITVKVNGTPVDSFFGPGKTIDVTRLIKAGQNDLEWDAKQMGEQYNKHVGEASAKLMVQLVSGPHISDTFKKSDVLLSYERTAADTEDSTQTLHFAGE